MRDKTLSLYPVFEGFRTLKALSKTKLTNRLILTGKHVRAAAAEVRDGAPRPDHGQHRRQAAGEAAPAAHHGHRRRRGSSSIRAVWADVCSSGAGEGDCAAGAEVDRVQDGDGREGVPAAAQPGDPAGARAQEEQGLQRQVRPQILNIGRHASGYAMFVL